MRKINGKKKKKTYSTSDVSPPEGSGRSRLTWCFVEFMQQTEHFFAMDTVGVGLCTKGTTNGHKHGLGTVPHFSNGAET